MNSPKIKQKAKDESENEVKRKVAEYLIKAGYTLYRINNAPVAFKRFHGKKGVSDTIAFKPGEYALAIEGKSTGKKPSNEQMDFLELVNASKGIVGFHYDSLDRFLQLYSDIKHDDKRN